MSISLILLLVVTLVRLAIFAFVIYAAVQGSRPCGSTTAPGGPKGEGGDPPLAGEVLKEHRVRCRMTQEFVAESLGVSRQAVSKWETGTADPSTSICWRWRSCSAYPRRNCCGRWTGRTRKKTESNSGGPQVAAQHIKIF